MVTGGQVGQGLYTVVAEPDPETVTGGQVGQGSYTVWSEPDPKIVEIGQVEQGLVTVVEALTASATCPEGTYT